MSCVYGCNMSVAPRGPGFLAGVIAALVQWYSVTGPSHGQEHIITPGEERVPRAGGWDIQGSSLAGAFLRGSTRLPVWLSENPVCTRIGQNIAKNLDPICQPVEEVKTLYFILIYQKSGSWRKGSGPAPTTPSGYSRALARSRPYCHVGNTVATVCWTE